MRNQVLLCAVLMAFAAGYAYAGCSTTGTTTSCTNSTTITIPATSFNGALESSAQTVSGITGSIQTITLSLNNWTDNGTTNGPGTEDREFMLVFQPTGCAMNSCYQTFQFLGGLALTGTTIFNNENITFEDSATLYAPDEDAYSSSPPNGDKPPTNPTTYKPTVNKANNYCSGTSSDGSAAFSGAPFTSAPCATDNPADPQYESSGGTATFASQFSGSPNGTWTLYVWTNKDAEDDGATIGGWTLNITVAANAANTSTSLSSNATNNETFESDSVTLTATVTSTSTPSEGTITFTDNGSDLTCSNSSQPVPVSGGTASCTTTFSTEGNHPLEAQYTGDANYGNSSGSMNFFVDHATTNPSTGQYCNTGTININTNNAGPGTTPYPQHIFIPAQSGSLSDVSLVLPNITINQMNLFNFLLVDPNGNKFVPMAGTGGDGNASGVTLTLTDFATGQNPVPNPINGGNGDAPASGQYLPTDYNTGLTFASSPDGPPSGPYQLPQTQGGATFDTTFGGTNPQGMWSLYAYYAGGTTIGSIDGYCLNISTSAAVATNTTVTSSPMTEAATNTQVTFTATVKSGGNPVTSGSVTFKEGTTVLSGPTTVNGSGQVTFQTSSLAEGIHTIEAIYSGVTGTYNVSSGSVTIEIDTPTTNTAGTGLYCNPGGVNISSSNGGNNIPASPYPTRINVTNLAGTVNTVGVHLNNFSDGEPYGTVMLLEGPTSTNIVFYNDAGSESTGFSGLNLTLADSGSSQLPADPNNPTTNTTYSPASYQGLPPPVFPAPGPSGISQAAPAGSQTFSSAFQNINPLGYWTLYVYDRFGDEALSINNWCLNFTENAPVIAASMTNNPTNFTQGDTGDTVTVNIMNNGPGPTDNTLQTAVTLPTGLTATAIQGGGGTGWSCTLGTLTCTRTSGLAASASDNITVTVNVGYNAPSSVTPSATISGGGISATQNPSDTVTVNPGPVQVTFSTVPAGLSYNVDSTSYTSQQTLPLTNGSMHTIATTSPQTSGGVQNTFSSWSDGGTQSHSITINSTTGTASYTANFTTTYLLTTQANPTNGGTVSPASGYYAPSTMVPLTATPAKGYIFQNWTGSVASPNSASTSITTTSSPQTVTANFILSTTVSISPSSLFFPSRDVGTTSPAQTLTLTTTGSNTLTIGTVSASIPDYVILNDNCSGQMITSKAKCTLQVEFQPTTSGSRNGTLSFPDNAANSPQTVKVTASAVGAQLTPPTHVFPAQHGNTTSPTTVTLTLTNFLSTTLSYGAATFSGNNPTDFPIQNGGSCSTSGGTLAANGSSGNSCTFVIAFQPTANGNESATLSITDNAGTQSATVSGYGVGASLAPPKGYFPAQRGNTQSSTNLSITFTNYLSSPLSYTPQWTGTNSGDFLVQSSSTCPNSGGAPTASTLGANSSCTYVVAFKPTANGPESATLSISDADGTQTSTFSGTGVGAQLAPSSYSFGSYPKGRTSSAKTFTLNNYLSTPLSVTGTSFSGTNGTDFSLTNGGTCPAMSGSVPGNSSCTYNIVFQPSTTSSETATFTVTDADGSQSTALSGSGH
ncbi:MAG: choice-of-anchor D domain-containing protein [Acidobacteriaceae bacterium]|nr:choice-of-anchor D domain-containing protein [Acidobacteriaceae bacterium]MBV9781900.1 choice-of-anchor D domain-containing protein [Acidobacteriaceae bacterium]